MSEVEIKRRMGEEDIASVAALLAAAQHHDGHAPLGEHKWLDLVEGGRAGFAGFVAREPGRETVVGYAQLSRGPSSWSVEYVVHPARREPEERIGRDLLRAALGEVARGGGGHVHLWVPKPTAASDATAAALGLRRGRELLQLRRPLPIEEALAAAALPTRPFEVGRDEQDWLELNAKAFAGHPEQGDWDLDTLCDRERQPWFEAAGFLLHEHEGALDAFCWTKVHEEEPLGEIYVIGVDPARQGQGLGRGLLAAGLAHLGARRLPSAMLYVDADNEAAMALYRAFGFATDHHDLAYVIDVAALP
jgi:mycothiol synthase